jgi:pimeloyl-ACP methyl ester carboxylesterase
MKTIWYIHGAASTHRSFNYLKARLPRHDSLDIDYNHDGPVAKVVDSLVKRIDAHPTPVTLVGHSLGGVIAVAAAQRSQNVERVATLAAPFGGSQVAALMRWICPSQLLDDIHPQAPLIRTIKRTPVQQSVMAIVSTGGGTPMLTGENDGVVTVDSQTALRGPVYLRVPVNHFEILLCEESVELISGFILS